MTMKGVQAAMIEAHRSNIKRYAWLLTTELTETERAFVHRRMAEEHGALERLMVPEVDISAGALIAGEATSASEDRYAFDREVA